MVAWTRLAAEDLTCIQVASARVADGLGEMAYLPVCGEGRAPGAASSCGEGSRPEGAGGPPRVTGERQVRVCGRWGCGARPSRLLSPMEWEVRLSL